jgi:hypothetical protein
MHTIILATERIWVRYPDRLCISYEIRYDVDLIVKVPALPVFQSLLACGQPTRTSVLKLPCSLNPVFKLLPAGY